MVAIVVCISICETKITQPYLVQTRFTIFMISYKNIIKLEIIENVSWQVYSFKGINESNAKLIYCLFAKGFEFLIVILQIISKLIHNIERHKLVVRVVVCLHDLVLRYLSLFFMQEYSFVDAPWKIFIWVRILTLFLLLS